MTYALDTNTIIHYLRKTDSVVQSFDTAVAQGDAIAVPKIVDYEMKRGFRILSAPRKEAAYKVMTGISGFCHVAEMDSSCWERAEHIYEELYRKRFTVGEMDMLIAAICLENGYTLVTDNMKDFKNISGLYLENWVE